MQYRDLLGRRGSCPQCGHRFVLKEPGEVEFELADGSELPIGTGARWVPDNDPPAEPAAAVSSTPSPAASTEIQFSEIPGPEFTGIGNLETNSGGVRRLKEIKRKGARRRNVGIAVGGLIAFALLAVCFAVFCYVSYSH